MNKSESLKDILIRMGNMFEDFSKEIKKLTKENEH